MTLPRNSPEPRAAFPKSLRDGESTARGKAKKKESWHGRKGEEGGLGMARRTSNVTGAAARGHGLLVLKGDLRPPCTL